jgi:hypothetical protein
MGNKALQKNRAFGAARAIQRKPTAIETLSKLHNTIQNLEKREIVLGKRVAMHLKIARQNNKAGKKKVALNHMRRKRLMEKELNKLNNMKINLQQQIMCIEGTEINSQVISAMKAGQENMKALNNKHTIEDIETLHEDMEEQTERAEEINSIMGEPIGAMANMDEDELEKELNELMAEDRVATQSPTKILTPILQLPNVPQTIPATPEIPKEELEALEELEKQMVLA